MAIVHPDATLTPHFRQFLPPWLAAQSWYRATAGARFRPVGYYRLDDPDGQVGLETHLISDGEAVYQLPLSYREAELPDAAGALIAIAEHSVLGTRWIYDAVHDPVWVAELKRVVHAQQPVEVSTKSGGAPVSAFGHWLIEDEVDSRIELVRVPVDGPVPAAPGLAGVLLGCWHPDGADRPPAHGPLALLYRPD